MGQNHQDPNCDLRLQSHIHPNQTKVLLKPFCAINIAEQCNLLILFVPLFMAGSAFCSLTVQDLLDASIGK